MKITGEQMIKASRQRVWEALNDPEVLKQCIPGCQSLEKEADDRLKATVAIKVGPIGARFNGAVTLSELDPPNSYVISGEGQGGTAGFAKGSARVKLTEDNGGTLLNYEVNAEVGGRLAQVGGVIIDATAKQLSGVFFKRFGEIVTAPAAVAAEPAPAAAASPQPSAGEEAATATLAPTAAVSAPPLLPRAAPPEQRRSPFLWIVAVFLAALAGFLVGNEGTVASPAWLGLVIGAIIAIIATIGFEFGRRSTPAVITLDPAVTDLLIRAQGQRS
jgi:carbon monoxide dehydrogenase subunit G